MHSDLNQGPIDLQSIALPLSYTPLLRKAEKTLQTNPHYAMYAEQANRVETLVLHLHNCFKNKCFYVLPSIFLSCHMTSCQKFLQLYKKMQPMKASWWYVLTVKNMHSWSSSKLCGSWSQAKTSYIKYVIR